MVAVGDHRTFKLTEASLSGIIEDLQRPNYNNPYCIAASRTSGSSRRDKGQSCEGYKGGAPPPKPTVPEAEVCGSLVRRQAHPDDP